MQLRQYQDDAVKELLGATLRNLVQKGTRTLVLKSPTGSGKTVMMQEYLRRLVSTPMDREYAFVWISVNDLSRQSKRSFERNLAGSSLHFSELSDITDRELQAGEILFINWESINKVDGNTGEWKVLAMKDNERDENLPTYLANTHAAGRGIILIVDESHKNLDSPRAQDLIVNYIKPKLQIEVSATPDSRDVAQTISVDIDDVIEAGMIKKEILINPSISHVGSTTDHILIESALMKRQELIDGYEREGSPIRPLILIQLPSDSGSRKSTKTLSDLDLTKIEHTKAILATHGITLANHRLAIWLSDDKTNKDLINDRESPVEVLIFKQAIATGWDCPRAQILVMFREMQSIVFQIQTVGRILRMPEQRHYTDHILNTAYVYTDFAPGRGNIGIHETAKNLIKDRLGYRKESYAPIGLKSTFLKRVEYRDLGKSFYDILRDTFLSSIGGSREAILGDNMRKMRDSGFSLDKNANKIIDTLITDGKLFVDIDHHTGERIYTEMSIEARREEDLVKMAFDAFARERVGPHFTNIARSYRAIIEALYRVLEKYILGNAYSRYDMQCLMLSNESLITDILTQAKENYLPIRRAEVEERRKDEIMERVWGIPMVTAFSDDAVEAHYTRSIIDPLYVGKLFDTEEDFIEFYLEKNETIQWWYRNGVKSEQFFSIVYVDIHGETQNFFPDFIVRYNDGTLGIFDTKEGWTLEEGREKHRALSTYLQSEREKSVQIIGGFVRSQGAENIAFYQTISDEYAVDGMEGWQRL